MSIKLKDAAKYYKELKHQTEAWDALEKQLTPEQLAAFESKYRQTHVVENTENNWHGVVAAAKKAGAKFPEVVAAQWALESNWGKNTPEGNYNYFGLKGDGTKTNTQEFINGKWITIQDSFLNFPDLYTCVCYLVDRWYKDYGRFQGVNRASTRDDCARLLVKEGYATDPTYADKLIQIMNQQKPAVAKKEEEVKGVILTVPYEYQLDNRSGRGYRECFSSTCAMIAEYYGKIKGDDEYNQIRSRYGDTTSKDAQVAALKYLGLNVKFITNGNSKLLQDEINAGRPVAVGWLHKGNISYPTGGGHWTCCIGYTPNTFIFNDPNGEADMVNGGYVSHDSKRGKAVQYSRQNWLRRWECDGKNTGWALLVAK